MAIKTICNKGYTYQCRLSRKVREKVAHELLVEGEKTVDLLLSIITCMAWYKTLQKFIMMNTNMS